MVSKSTFWALLLILSLSVLAGCASTYRSQSLHVQYSANQYLQMATNATGTTKQLYLLQASSRFIDEKRTNRAQAILKQVDNNLSPHLRLKKQLISAKLLVAYNQNDQALSALQAMGNDQSSWAPQDKIEWHSIAANANDKLGNVNASIQQRSDIIPLLPSDQRKPHLLTIWEQLENISPSRIRYLLSQATTPTVQGWLSLAMITDQPTTPAQQLSNQLQHWKSDYANHPAVALLPSSLQPLKNIPTNYPRHIALLLPLTGRLAKAGDAIRNGFFAAYYTAKQYGQFVPKITLINTADKNIIIAYQEALSKGVNFVIGPLTKNNVVTLAKTTHLRVPTLALNSIPNISETNLYQFGLSPMDEAQQAAIKAWNSQDHNALVIVPDNHWGQSIATTFEKTWHSLGGEIVGKLAYTTQKNLSTDIRHLLNIDQASWNEVTLKRLLRERLRYIPRRRQDVDIIFLVATPDMARQIQPLLRYFYAGSIPVYSISTVYSGQPHARRDHDLNGIRFPDMPWVLSAQMNPDSLNSIRQRAQQIWPQSYATESKLIALGVDAYNIIAQLNKMAMLPDLGTSAATGMLYLNKDHRIYRKLRWSTIHNGKPQQLQ